MQPQKSGPKLMPHQPKRKITAPKYLPTPSYYARSRVSASLGSPFPIRESHHLPRPSRVPDRARPRFGTANVQPCPALQEGEQKEIRGTPRACSRVQPPNTSKLTLHVAAGDQALHGSPALNLNLICNHTRTGPDPQRIPAVTTNERLEFPSRAPSPSFPPPPASPASAPLLVHPRYLRHVRKTFLGSGVT